MVMLRVIPEGLAGASAAVAGLTARLAAAHAVAAPAITAVIPPTGGPGSVRNAGGVRAGGVEHSAMAPESSGGLGRSRVGVGEAGISYTVGDEAAAAGYGAFGGLW